MDTPKPDTNISDVSPDAGLPSETWEGQLSAMAAERDQLAAEKADLCDRLLRARAEFDNARRRAERERSDFLQFAAMDLVKDLLPVLDDFERALKVETAEAEDQTVLGEFQRGYNFKGKLLRPAMVRVAVKP